MKYRVEARLFNLSNGKKWGAHTIEFDTELDSRWLVKDRFQSIYKVLLRAIGKHEKLAPNPDKYPLACSPMSEVSKEGMSSEAPECRDDLEVLPASPAALGATPPEEEPAVRLRYLDGGQCEISVVLEKNIPPEFLQLLRFHKDPARLIRRALALSL